MDAMPRRRRQTSNTEAAVRDWPGRPYLRIDGRFPRTPQPALYGPGRRRPVPIQGSKFKLACDLAVIAVGAGANPILTESTEGLKLNKWGYIVADPETGKTTKKAVWAGGDIVTGAATVILAMGAGRKASDSIHDYLTLGW